MFSLTNYDNWEPCLQGLYGSGAGEKIWLMNKKTGELGIFKFPKIKSDGSITGEYWAEKLASELGKILGIKCAKVEMGICHNRVGSMSYNFLDENCVLDEGIAFITREYPNYDPDKLYDETSDTLYNIHMVSKVVPEYLDNILKMCIFDGLIGNSDRHHSNWGIVHQEILGFSDEPPFKIIEQNNHQFAPLYDNGSSLCCFVDENETCSILNDGMRFAAMIYSKSMSAIGWNKKRPIRHFDMMCQIRNEYYSNTLNTVQKIASTITKSSVDSLLDQFDDDIMNNKVKLLLSHFLVERRNRLAEIWEV